MCAEVSDWRRAATLTGRRSAIHSDRKKLYQSAQRQFVAIGAEAADHGYGSVCEGRATALGLAGGDVGEVDFDERNLHSCQRIANGEAGMAIGARIPERTGGATPQSGNSFDHLAFPGVLGESEL